MENWDVALLVLFIIVTLCVAGMASGFGPRTFDMTQITGRPSYAQANRETYDNNLTVLETLPYPRSGQPFQFTQQQIQDARQPTDEQFRKTMTLFEVAGTPMWGTQTRALRTMADGRAAKTSHDGGDGSSSTRDFRSKQVRGFSGGSAEVLESAGASGRGVSWWDHLGGGVQDSGRQNAVSLHPDASVGETRGFAATRGMADLDLSGDNLAAVKAERLLPSYEGGLVGRDPRNGGLVWTGHAGPEAGPWGAKWQQTSPDQPVLPLDDPRARAVTGPMQVPSGGLMEQYSDANYYTAPGKTDFAMADGLPFDWSKKMIGPDGKVWTGQAYVAAEPVPHLDMLPSNHPAKLADRHWFAANVKNRVTPTEARKGLEYTIIGDVKRYREIPWSFGGA